MAKITLTKAEANEIIRKHFGVASDFEIEIEITDGDVLKDADGWIDVPVDWEKMYHPAQAETYDKIEVMYQDYSTNIGEPTCWNVSWSRNTTNAIIKYREVK